MGVRPGVAVGERVPGIVLLAVQDRFGRSAAVLIPGRTRLRDGADHLGVQSYEDPFGAQNAAKAVHRITQKSCRKLFQRKGCLTWVPMQN